MNGLRQRLFTNWHLMRIVRTAIGVWMLVMAIQSRDWAVGLFGAFFLYQGIADVTCCGANGCYTSGRRIAGSAKTNSDFEYEEVK